MSNNVNHLTRAVQGTLAAQSRPRTHRARLALLLVLLVGAWIGAACEQSVVSVLEQSGPPAAGDGDSVFCFSDFTQIRMVGEFSSWNIANSPVMVQGGDECAWTTTVKFDVAGETIFKFLTGESFDEPGFLGNEADVLTVGQEHDVDRSTSAGGQGNAITIEVPAPGCYEFRLFEERDSFQFDEVSCSSGGIGGYVTFENAAQPPFPKAYVRALLNGVMAGSDSSSADDGRFEVTGLAEGTYDVVVSAFGFLSTQIDSVEVGESIVEVDTVRLTAGCVSSFETIQVAGEITVPQWDLSVAPALTQLEGCRWEADISVEAGQHFFKLVTNGAFDNDYGGDETLLSIDSTHAVQLVSGEGTALLMDFPFDGSYRFILDEEASTLRVEPGNVAGDLAGVAVFEAATGQPLPVASVGVLDAGTEIASTTSSSEDGSFRMTGVAQGLYDVRIEPPLAAPTHRDTVIAGVGIGGGTRNLGQVFVRRATGELRGTVAFMGLTGAPPPATIEVRLDAGVAATRTTTAQSTSFAITGLKSATYNVVLSAEGYIDSTVVVSVANGISDLGTVELERLVCAAYPTLESMKLGGARLVANEPNDVTFTWNPGNMPVMTRVDRCVWETQITAEFASVYRVKFITNGDFVAGDPPAFGGDDTTMIPPDSLATVVGDPMPGTGNALRITIPQTGIYRFTLDLDQVAFSFTRIADLPDDPPPLTDAQPVTGTAGERAIIED